MQAAASPVMKVLTPPADASIEFVQASAQLFEQEISSVRILESFTKAVEGRRHCSAFISSEPQFIGTILIFGSMKRMRK